MNVYTCHQEVIKKIYFSHNTLSYELEKNLASELVAGSAGRNAALSP